MILKENSFIRKKFIKLFIAEVFAWVIGIAADLFESFAAATYIDNNAVAALEIGQPITFIVYAVGLIIAYSVGILYTRALGKQDKEKSQKIAGMALILAIVFGAILTIIVYFSAEWFVGLYDCSIEVREYAILSVKNRVFYVIPCIIFLVIYYLVQYDADHMMSFASDVVATILSVFGPGLFAKYFGFFGITIVGGVLYTIATMIVCIHFFTKRNSISFKPYFSFKLFIEFIKLSSSAVLTYIYLAIIDIVFNGIIVSRFGDIALPAYTVVNAMLNFAEAVSAGISSGQMFISIAYGEGSNKSIVSIMKMIIKYATVFSIILSTLLIIIAPYWPNLFSIEDTLIKDCAIFAGSVIPITYFFSVFVYSFQNYYSTIDKPLYSNIIALLYMLIMPVVICVPIALTSSFKAMSVGFALTPVATVAFMIIYFVVSKKKDAPLFVDTNKNKEYHYNIILNEENIIEVRNQVLDVLKNNNTNAITLNEISVVIEDALLLIKNKNNKEVIAEITILIDDIRTRLIIKDSGKIFNLIKEAEMATSLRAYTVDRLTSQTYEKSNDIAVSFNRNVFSWNI